jgi:hypothetical protein
MVLIPLGPNVSNKIWRYFSFLTCSGVTFFVMGALTSTSVVHLFTTPLLATVAAPHVGVLVITVAVAALLLAVSYNEISKRKHASLLSSRYVAHCVRQITLPVSLLSL